MTPFNKFRIFTIAAVSVAALGCNRTTQSDTAPAVPDDSYVSTGQPGASGSTMPKDAMTQSDANAADDLDAKNDTGQSAGASVSGSSLSGNDEIKRETPRVVNPNSAAGGSGTADVSKDTNTKTEVTEKTKRDRIGM